MSRKAAPAQEARIKSVVAGAVLSLWSASVTSGSPEVQLTVGGHAITVEVAATESQRSTGLMHRRMLPENRGMLFVFPDVAMHGMWMMNTYVPLSVAFLDREGTIINIADMQPQTQTTHTAARPAKYALEANRGWFAKRGIKPGTKVKGIEKAGPAR